MLSSSFFVVLCTLTGMKTYFIEGVRDSKPDSESDGNHSPESPEDDSPQNGASKKLLPSNNSSDKTEGSEEHKADADSTEKSAKEPAPNLEVYKTIFILCLYYVFTCEIY